jgi:hypothetical protein
MLGYRGPTFYGSSPLKLPAASFFSSLSSLGRALRLVSIFAMSSLFGNITVGFRVSQDSGQASRTAPVHGAVRVPALAFAL